MKRIFCRIDYQQIFLCFFIFLHASIFSMNHDELIAEQSTYEMVENVVIQEFLGKQGKKLFEQFYTNDLSQDHYQCYREFLDIIKKTDYPLGYLPLIIWTTQEKRSSMNQLSKSQSFVTTTTVSTTWPFIALLYQDEKMLKSYLQAHLSRKQYRPLMHLPTCIAEQDIQCNALSKTSISPIALAVTRNISTALMNLFLQWDVDSRCGWKETKELRLTDSHNTLSSRCEKFYTIFFQALLFGECPCKNFLLLLQENKFDPHQETVETKIHNGNKTTVYIKNSLLVALGAFVALPHYMVNTREMQDEDAYVITKTSLLDETSKKTNFYKISTVKKVLFHMLKESHILDKDQKYFALRPYAGYFMALTLLNASSFESYYTQYFSKNFSNVLTK